MLLLALHLYSRRTSDPTSVEVFLATFARKHTSGTSSARAAKLCFDSGIVYLKHGRFSLRFGNDETLQIVEIYFKF